MTDEHMLGNDEPVREFQLEGVTLYIVVAILVVVLAGVFYLGRRFERARWTSGEARTEEPAGEGTLYGDGESGEALEELPIEEQIDFFDTVPGDGDNAEPLREARSPETEGSAKEAVLLAPAVVPPENPGGQFFIQVLAARDRRSAEEVASSLDAAGFPARIHTEQDGSGTWYKVQVGGYADREAASSVLDKLKQAGYKSAWTTRVD